MKLDIRHIDLLIANGRISEAENNLHRFWSCLQDGADSEEMFSEVDFSTASQMTLLLVDETFHDHWVPELNDKLPWESLMTRQVI